MLILENFLLFKILTIFEKITTLTHWKYWMKFNVEIFSNINIELSCNINYLTSKNIKSVQTLTTQWWNQEPHKQDISAWNLSAFKLNLKKPVTAWKCWNLRNNILRSQSNSMWHFMADFRPSPFPVWNLVVLLYTCKSCAVLSCLYK